MSDMVRHHPVLEQVALPDGYWKAVGGQTSLQRSFGLTSERIRDIVVGMVAATDR